MKIFLRPGSLGKVILPLTVLRICASPRMLDLLLLGFDSELPRKSRLLYSRAQAVKGKMLTSYTAAYMYLT